MSRLSLGKQTRNRAEMWLDNSLSISHAETSPVRSFLYSTVRLQDWTFDKRHSKESSTTPASRKAKKKMRHLLPCFRRRVWSRLLPQCRRRRKKQRGVWKNEEASFFSVWVVMRRRQVFPNSSQNRKEERRRVGREEPCPPIFEFLLPEPEMISKKKPLPVLAIQQQIESRGF